MNLLCSALILYRTKPENAIFIAVSQRPDGDVASANKKVVNLIKCHHQQNQILIFQV